MSDNKYFPNSEISALALLWVEKHADEAESPEDLCRMYWQAAHRISAANKAAMRGE